MTEPLSSEQSPVQDAEEYVPLPIRVMEYIIASRLSAALFMLVLVSLTALAFTGIGVFSTNLLRPIEVVREIVAPIAQTVAAAPQPALSRGARTTFYCTDTASIRVLFFGEQVELALSDGRKVVLPETTPPGTFTNPDGSFVFWLKNGTATILEDGRATYSNCVAD